MTYIDAGWVGFAPKRELLRPVSVMYACNPSGENVIPASSVSILLRRILLGQHTVWSSKAVSYNSQSPSLRIKTIYLIPQTRLGTEMLPIAIHRVSEINMDVAWVDGDVVDGVKLPAEVVVHKN